jgi:hypothetical protein
MAASALFLPEPAVQQTAHQRPFLQLAQLAICRQSNPAHLSSHRWLAKVIIAGSSQQY